MQTLDNLLVLFFKELGSIVPDYEEYIWFSDRPEWILPAKHPETGEMYVWLDGDKITLRIGEHFYTHFSTYYLSSNDSGENERKAVRKAVEFIRDVLADKVVIYISSRAAGSYYRGSTNAPSMKPGMREYVWSGPFVRVE